MMILMMGLWLLIPLLLIGAVVYALNGRPQFSHMKLAQNSQTPLEILKVRYARGQISREEFDQIHSDLQS